VPSTRWTFIGQKDIMLFTAQEAVIKLLRASVADKTMSPVSAAEQLVKLLRTDLPVSKIEIREKAIRFNRAWSDASVPNTTSRNPECLRLNAGNLPLVAFLEARKIVQGLAERRLYPFKIVESRFKH
jgi:hypothetical protein